MAGGQPTLGGLLGPAQLRAGWALAHSRRQVSLARRAVAKGVKLAEDGGGEGANGKDGAGWARH